MEREVRVIQTPGFDIDYWLCRCEGFQVETPEGRLGIVEWLRFRSRHDRPDALAVRAGRIVRRSLVVPVSEIAQVVPSEGRIVLRSAPAQPGHVRALRRRLAGAHVQGGVDSADGVQGKA